MDSNKLKPILEALFAASDKPLSVNQLFELFAGDIEQPGKDDIRKAIQELTAKYEGSGFELKQVASGFRFQVRVDFETWVARMWEQKPPRYSRALMETLALIAYRQPITRGEIEDIRGVSVSTNIIKTLQERDWIKSLGHKEVPGRPTLYGTTRTFLDYFNLKSLNELPTLAEIRNLDHYNPEFEFDREAAVASSDAAPKTGSDKADRPSADAETETDAPPESEAAEPEATESEAAESEAAESEAAESKAAESEAPEPEPEESGDGKKGEAEEAEPAVKISETAAAPLKRKTAKTKKSTTKGKKKAAPKKKTGAKSKKTGAD